MKHTPFFAALSALALTCASAFSASPNTFTTHITGHGAPMILIPGLACPGAVWDTTVAALSKDYECHVVSIAGFGGVPANPSDQPLLESVRDELAAYIRNQHLQKPVIVGHSLGGFLALELAVRYPDLPRALVIVDSLPFLMGIMRPGATLEDAKNAADSLSASFAHMTPEAYAQMIRSGPNGSTMAAAPADQDRIIAWGLASDAPSVVKAMKEMYTTDLRSEIAAIKVPTLVLGAWIAYSPYSSHEIATRLYGDQYSKLTGVQIQISDTSRHFIMFDAPDWLFSSMRTFLNTPLSATTSK